MTTLFLLVIDYLLFVAVLGACLRRGVTFRRAKSVPKCFPGRLLPLLAVRSAILAHLLRPRRLLSCRLSVLSVPDGFAGRFMPPLARTDTRVLRFY
ncbi:MAG: hypothetical protein PUD40_07170 [Bacteroidales bacterium]|nr:hypothetical protein [Bacteroidales bacterium]